LLSGIAGERHLDLVAGPIGRATGLPVLGYLPPRREFALPERHLGLVPAGEQGVGAAFFDRLAAQAEATLDLERLRAIAHAAPALPALPAPAHLAPLFPERAAARPAVRIALALDDAFHFYYEDGLDLLRAHGAELVPFSPLADAALPEGTQGVYLGGGFPEVFAASLAANRTLLADVRVHVEHGLVTWAECGGLLWLSRSLDGHALCGALAAQGRMSDRLTLGYRTARTACDTPVAPAGTELRGHEFHYSVLDPPGDALAMSGRNGARRAGYASPRLLASYLHLHLAADPTMAERFVATASAMRS
jgi:cobyrinic acid a,c-diamide synthase